MNLDMHLCGRIADTHPYPLIFATISGAHLYGFPSPDSDYDLRGVHLLPPRELLSLDEPRETIESEGVVDGVEMDLVTHDVGKFFRLLLKRNGYVLEQLLSPLVVRTSPAHQELCSLAPQCITRHYAHHYLGFADTQWNLFVKDMPPRVKPLLYVYRVLLTGIHLMRTGTIEANLVTLNTEYAVPKVDELISRKVGTAEQSTLSADEIAFHADHYARWRARLEEEHARSTLPDTSNAHAALSDLLVRLRLG